MPRFHPKLYLSLFVLAIVLTFTDHPLTTSPLDSTTPLAVVRATTTALQAPEPPPPPTAAATTARTVSPISSPTEPPSQTVSPKAATTDPTTPTPDARLLPRYWRQWPVIPSVSEKARKIFIRGVLSNNDLHAFSTIGDCQSMPAVFSGMYDVPDSYRLGEGYEHLQATIDHFAGSFSRRSVTVKNGLSAATVFSPIWSDADLCEPDETPIVCEFRLHRPSIVFINLGTNWKPGYSARHEELLREIVSFAVDHGTVPILSTKADNVEEDQSINEGIARVAYDYEVPLWNFWRAVQYLPNHGLDDRGDGNYLSTEAWGVRGFTGLQALDAVWSELERLFEANP